MVECMMSTQRRIDQYFSNTKTSSSQEIGCDGRKTVKISSNSSKLSRSLPRLNNNARNAAKTTIASAGKKKSSRRRNSAKSAWHTVAEIPKTLGRPSTSSSFANSQASKSESFEDIDSDEIQIIDTGSVTATKQTIKSFTKACNSRSVNNSPGKISLKRQKTTFPSSQSPPKKALIDDKVDSESNVLKISASSSSLPEAESSRIKDDFPGDFDPDIVELNATIVFENSIEKLSETIEGESSTIDKVNVDIEELSHTEKKKLQNNCSTPGQIKTNVTPKGKNNNNNLSSNSPWKVAVTINTPDRSMTALSSDWETTLEALKKPSRPSSCDKNKSTKENLETMMTNREGNDENLSDQTQKISEINTCPKSRDYRVNNAPAKSSPRRALLSPPSTPKKVCFETKDSSLPEVNAETNVPALTNGSKNSPVGILRSANLRINSQSNSPSNKVEPINSLGMRIEALHPPTKRVLFNEPAVSPVKINNASNLPTNEMPKSPEKINTPAKSIESPMKPNSSSNSPSKSNMPQASSSSNSSSQSPTKTNGIPTTPTKTPTKTGKSSFSPRVKNSPQKKQKERVDTEIATRAVENMNQARQGIIPMNDFDLEAIYTKNSFVLEYGSLNTDTAIKYEAKDVEIPEDKHGDHFFMVFANVFSEPMNCGYFDQEELDIVFSMLTLRPQAQSLLTRMLKRKRGWHRVSAIDYKEIGPDLTPFFNDLVKHRFLDSDIGKEEMSKLLHILGADEVRAVCQSMKVNHKGVKNKLVEDLIKLSSQNQSLFPGMKTPSSALREKVTSLLGFCIRIPQRIEDLLNRIFILLIPNQDPSETIVDALNMLTLVHLEEKIFPPTPKERFPIFRDRSHLIRYAEARSAWNQMLKATEPKPPYKDWDTVRVLGHLAYDRLQPYFESNDNGDETAISTVPSHVKRFDANYVWTRVLSNSVEAYKKPPNPDIDTAVKFLEALISKRNRMPGNRIRWYNELALIESHHRKDLERSANVTIEALELDRLSEVDAADMLDRARKLLKRCKGISLLTKARINTAVRLRQEMFIPAPEPKINEMEARMVQGNVTGSKSSWEVAIGNDTGYMTVEQVALCHYYNKGYNGGLHCEGALPVTLFATLLWEEIYEIFVPGAFASPYQDAPLDLYNASFFESRRDAVEMKLRIAGNYDLTKLSHCMQEDFVKYRHYQSLLHGNLFKTSEDFKDFIECLGHNGVVGICRLLAGNFNQWKSGFPDLVVWNTITKECKIVEVKGPGDTLSTKQKLWIQLLESLGVDVEVCVVKGTTVKCLT